MLGRRNSPKAAAPTRQARWLPLRKHRLKGQAPRWWQEAVFPCACLAFALLCAGREMYSVAHASCAIGMTAAGACRPSRRVLYFLLCSCVCACVGGAGSVKARAMMCVVCSVGQGYVCKGG